MSCQVINLKPWRPAVPSFYGASSTGMQLLALRLSTERLGWPCGCAGCLQVIAIVARSDGTRAASIGVDGCLRLWDAATGICISNKVCVSMVDTNSTHAGSSALSYCYMKTSTGLCALQSCMLQRIMWPPEGMQCCHTPGCRHPCRQTALWYVAKVLHNCPT